MFSDIKFKVTHLGVKGGAEDEAFETQRKAFEKYEKTLRALVKSLEKLEKAFKGTIIYSRAGARRLCRHQSAPLIRVQTFQAPSNSLAALWQRKCP